MSATVGAALKKIAVALLSNKKVAKGSYSKPYIRAVEIIDESEQSHSDSKPPHFSVEVYGQLDKILLSLKQLSLS